jgi:hypothetical protein
MVHIASVLMYALIALLVADARGHKTLHRLCVYRPLRSSGVVGDGLLVVPQAPEHVVEPAVLVTASKSVAWTASAAWRRARPGRYTAPSTWAGPLRDVGVVCLT